MLQRASGRCSCAHDSELLGTIKGRQFLDQLSEYRLLKVLNAGQCHSSDRFCWLLTVQAHIQIQSSPQRTGSGKVAMGRFTLNTSVFPCQSPFHKCSLLIYHYTSKQILLPHKKHTCMHARTHARARAHTHTPTHTFLVYMLNFKVLAFNF
jgi:hypothetical protein